VHRQSSIGCSRPLVFRSVPVEFDAVLVGVVEVEGFADAVIAGAVELDAGRDQSAEGVGEGGACRIENGEVIETGCASGRRRAVQAIPGVQAKVMVIGAGGNAGGLGSISCHDLAPTPASIKVQRSLEVGDLEVDVADA